MNTNKHSAPFPLPEKTKSKFPSASPLTTLLLRRSSSSQKEKLNKSGGEPDYEEIGPQMQNKLSQNDENSAHCDLCGSSDAAVRCDKCHCQAFCKACDETYHGHPKRANHVRKSLSGEVMSGRPPVPQKFPDSGGASGPTVAPPPQPPPRKNKRGLGLSSSFGSKEQLENETGRTLVGSLKKIMGNRPLPPPPDQNLDKRRNSTPDTKNSNLFANTSVATNQNGDIQSISIALPQSIMEINNKASVRKLPSSMPPTPPSAAHTQYPKVQAKSPPLPGRKLSLQQFPTNFEDKRASLVDGNNSSNIWDSQQLQQNDKQQQQQIVSNSKLRSQSVSDEQWNQMVVLNGSQQPLGFSGSTAASEVGGVSMAKRPFNPMSGQIRPFGRGMVSSASVCDLNTLNQHHQQHQQQQQQHPHHHPGYPNIHSANSFQQLSVMSYDPNMVWVQPSPCTLCQTPQVFPQTLGAGGMKRTTSNISMNLSTVGSDVTGYPWPHVHHHMPMGYPGYYPGCHQHMIPAGFPQGSAMSIPDSMKSYNRMPASPAPSVRSTSHRSHKSSKSRSYNAADAGRRSRNHSRKRSEESEESDSSSFSDEQEIPVTTSKGNKPGGLAWQCDHCTFINPGHVQSCGMCSKIPGKTTGRASRKGFEKRKSDKRKDKKEADSGENVISDYENEQRKDIRSKSRLKSSSSAKSSSGKSKKKSKRRESSLSHSSSGSGSDDEDEEVKLERQLIELRLTSRSRAGEYDGCSVTSRTRDKEKDRGSLKKEGSGRRYRNRRRYHSDRSMTPGKNTPQHSRKPSSNSEERDSAENRSGDEGVVHGENKSSLEGTLVGTTASESNTLKVNTTKQKSSSLKQWKGKLSLNLKKTPSHSEASISSKSSELEDPFDSPPKKEEYVETGSEHDEDEKDLVDEDVEQDVQEVVNIQDKEKETVVIKSNDQLGADLPQDPKDVDEPSFANTLDGIETLGTNEVADYEPSHALEYKIDYSEQMIRDLNKLMPEPKGRNTPEVIVVEYKGDSYQQSDHEEENIKEDLPMEQIFNVKDNDAKPNSGNQENFKEKVSHDPSYEVMDNPKTLEDDIIENENSRKSENEIVNEIEENVHVSDQKETKNEINTDEGLEKIKLEKENDSNHKIEIDEHEVSEDASESTNEHSNDIPFARGERQQSPLSVSSSDAQFYSPPNSPDLSFNERLHDKRIPNNYQTARPATDDDLVTALETMQTTDEHRSSKDTIQTSSDQLSDEVNDEVSSEEEATIPSILDTKFRTTEGGVSQSNDYSYQEARQHGDNSHLFKSASDQAISSMETTLLEEKSERQKSTYRSNSYKQRKTRKMLLESNDAEDDEEEIDEKYLTVEELIKRRKQKAMKEQGLQLVQILREAEEKGYNPEEVSVAINLCEKNKSPVEWLQENWRHMVDTVTALASNYEMNKSQNDVGEISSTEAKKALRARKGDIWAAVTDCVEQRQKKYNEIVSKGDFKREDVIKSLTDYEGDAEKALNELNKSRQSGSFFSKIWEGFMDSMPKVMSEKVKEKKWKENLKKSEEKLIQEEKKQNFPKEIRRKSEASKQKEIERKAKVLSSSIESEEELIYSAAQASEETENEIYDNFVNPLLEKLGDSLPKREDGAPLISEELKKKIVQAILEGDNEATNDNVVFDSEEESTIEELLAVAENPTFYDYFTAVDLEDFEENEEEEEHVEEPEGEIEVSTSSYDSAGISEEEEEEEGFEYGPVMTEGVQSDFEYFDEFKSVDTVTTTDEETDNENLNIEKDEIQYIREEDVVVHPLKAYGHFAELSRAKFTEEKSSESEKVFSPGQFTKALSSALAFSRSENINRSSPAETVEENQTFPKKESLFLQSMKWFFSLDRKKNENREITDEEDVTKSKTLPTNDEARKRYVSEEENVKAEEETEEEEDETEKEESDENENEEEESSLSITTGRLSLSLSQATSKGAEIGVKSHTVKAEKMSVPENVETFQNEKTDQRQNPKFEGTKNVSNNSLVASKQQDVSVPQRLDPAEVEKIRSRSGPVTVQKATQIVGMAIAKAMARESSVRRDSLSSDGSSLVGTPTSVSTPESEELPPIPKEVASEADEEELGPLDTILEEEEISEKTQSGRVFSRSSQNKNQNSAVVSPADNALSNIDRPKQTEPPKQDIEPIKSASIPQAVASFSGPIFIPSASSSAQKSPADNFSDSHTYYNDPAKLDSVVKQEEPSNPYESVKDAVKEEIRNEIKNKNVDVSKTLSASSSTKSPSSNNGPLTKDQNITKLDAKSNKERSSPSPLKDSKKELVPKVENCKTSVETSAQPTTSNNKNNINTASKTLPKSLSNSSLESSKGTKLKGNKSTSDIPSISGKTTEVKDQSHPLIEKDKNRSKGSIISKKPPTVPKKKIPLKEKSTNESSGESEEEENKNNQKNIEKVENLKNQGKVPDPQEVQELKEQIQMMKKELESQVDLNDEGKSSKSDTLQEDSKDDSGTQITPPTLIVEEPPEDEKQEEPSEEVEIEGEEVKDEEAQPYEQLKFDRTVRRLLAEGQATSYEKAELAAQLLTLSFDETDSIQAAEGCSSIYTALQFLQQECELCAEKYPMGKMVSMLHCVHRCCYDCANTYFSFQIKTKNVRELRCPFCNEPDLDASEEIAAEYLNNLDILLKNILDQETHELFQRKLRDWTLMKDPNFRWCNKCSSGFIANPRARKLICPDCKDVTCASCRKQWEAQHTGISCEAFAKYQEEQNPENQAESVARHLAENGITCPNCRFTYSLAKGGCMHFTCTECKYEFCSGCSQPFKQGAKCHVGPYCERLGLHSHHPRNCLFYLRDKEPGQLQQLLREHKIEFDTDVPPDSENTKKVCKVQEQKETMEGLRDDICGRMTQEGFAGLCRIHYIEYLVEKINNHGLDPVSIFDEADLRVCLRRNGKTVPVRRWESEKLYRDKLIKLIKEQLPLT